MPVLDLHISPNIYAWEIIESEEELRELVSLSEVELDLIFSFNRKQRRKEMLATRALLGTIISNEHIHYKKRAPFLVNANKEISISNSKNTVVIQLNNEKENTGVDIQYFSDTVLRVKHKFLNSTEHSLYTNYNEKEVLNIIWSAKETLYKAFTGDKLNFKSQIEIKEITNDFVTGIINREESQFPFKLGLFLNKDFCLTWFYNI